MSGADDAASLNNKDLSESFVSTLIPFGVALETKCNT